VYTFEASVGKSHKHLYAAIASEAAVRGFRVVGDCRNSCGIFTANVLSWILLCESLARIDEYSIDGRTGIFLNRSSTPNDADPRLLCKSTSSSLDDRSTLKLL
jgi:hypothetical protein